MLIAPTICLAALTMPEPGWLWRMAAFIALWTVELFAVQRATLISAELLTPRFERTAPRLRLVIDLCFTTFPTMLLPPAGLVVVSVLLFLTSTGLTFYSRYFMRPLSALTIYNNWREGAKAGRLSVASRLGGLVLALASLAIARIVLVLTAPGPGDARTWVLLVGGIALAGYLGLLVFASWKDPLSKIRTTRGIGRVGLIRGYFVTWLAEFAYLGSQQVRETAIRQREVVSDALSPVEAPFTVRRQLVIIQAESLDFNVLGLKVAGKEVTPFLNRLGERSLFYRIAAARGTGSSDADFIMLSGVMPSPHINTYNIRSYPYCNTLPQFLAQFGYRTSVFHGNTGNFYNRRGAFEKMGFEGIYFLEELVRDKVPACSWGIEDRQLLEYSANLLRQATGPACHFIITMSTHTPYRLLRSVERQVVADPQTMADDYYNNMRYLDNRLAEYIGSLSSATVVIYSDHPADSAVEPDFRPDCDGRRPRVPCFIFDTDSDLGANQRTRDEPIALDGRLTLLDISTFLRSQIEAGNRQSGVEFPQAAVG